MKTHLFSFYWKIFSNKRHFLCFSGKCLQKTIVFVFWWLYYCLKDNNKNKMYLCFVNFKDERYGQSL